MCLPRAFEVVFQSENGSPKRGELFHIHTDATAVFQDESPDAIAGGIGDHFQPAPLPRTPSIGWLTAQSSLIKIA